MTEQPPDTTTTESEPVEPEAPPADQESQPEAPQGADVEPPEPEPTPEELAAQEEAQHAHFLSTYEPVLTRLPDALGSAPEQEYVPADVDEEHDGE